MSTVLWANLLVDGKVQSEQADRYALYNHGTKLDTLTKSLGLTPFLEICDTTDLRYNTEDLELPPGVESTNDLMATEGTWIDTRDAVELLEKLLEHIRAKAVRFGMLSNQHAEVVAELAEVIEYVRANGTAAQKFNFSVVM
jgi:hypothetical protein